MSLPERRSAFNNLAAGGFFGALTAAGGVTVILGVLGVGMALSVATNWIAIGFFLVQGVAAIILAGIAGAAAGLLIAIVDLLIGGHMHDGRMPFWVWLPIGGVIGAAGSVLILAFPPGADIPTSSVAFYAIIGAFCGLIAGPVFGWFYRQRTPPSFAPQGGG